MSGWGAGWDGPIGGTSEDNMHRPVRTTYTGEPGGMALLAGQWDRPIGGTSEDKMHSGRHREE